MIELLYLASQIQCGSNGSPINVSIDVYQNSQLVTTMSVEERILLPVDSVRELTFKYSFVDASCSPSRPTEMLLGNNDSVPDLPGAYEQQSIQEILDGLKDYEELFLAVLKQFKQTK
ncbi:hypothetical protein [Myxosarcina sp. GI1(2024)]